MEDRTREQRLDHQVRALKAAGWNQDLRGQEVQEESRAPPLTVSRPYLRPGDTPVVRTLDRLARSFRGLVTLVGELHRAGTGFRSPHEALDTSTLGGRLVFYVFAALTEFIRELIAEGAQEGLDTSCVAREHQRRPRL